MSSTVLRKSSSTVPMCTIDHILLLATSGMLLAVESLYMTEFVVRVVPCWTMPTFCVPGTAKGHWRTRADIVFDLVVKPVFITWSQVLRTAQILQHWSFQ